MINNIPYETTIAIIFFVMFLAMFWAITQRFEQKTFLRIVMVSSLCYGTLIAVLVRTIFGDILENPAYFPDAYFYLSSAMKKVAEWRGEGALGYIPLATRGYTYFIAIIYSIFGPHIYIVIFVQLLLATLIPILTFQIAREFFSIKTAKLSALFVAFFPDFYVWASFALKEIIAVFSVCLAIFQFLKFRKQPKPTSFLTTIGPLVFLLFVRPHIALFLGFIFVAVFIWPITVKKLVWLLTGAPIFAIFMSKAGLSDVVTIVSKTPLFVYSRGEILVTGTLLELLKMTMSGQLLPILLLGVSRYLISPLPWQAANAYQAVIPGIILWYFMLPAAIFGGMEAIRVRKHTYILLVVVLFLILWYGLISTGTDPRWRLMIVPFMCILSAYGFQLLVKSVLGIMVWMCGVLAIWLFLSIYALGLEFVLWVLVPPTVIGTLVGLVLFRQRARRVIK